MCEQLIVGLCLTGRVCKTHARRGKRTTAQPAKHSRAFPVLEENMMWGFAYSSAAVNNGPHLELSFTHFCFSPASRLARKGNTCCPLGDKLGLYSCSHFSFCFLPKNLCFHPVALCFPASEAQSASASLTPAVSPDPSACTVPATSQLGTVHAGASPGQDSGCT